MSCLAKQHKKTFVSVVRRLCRFQQKVLVLGKVAWLTCNSQTLHAVSIERLSQQRAHAIETTCSGDCRSSNEAVQRCYAQVHSYSCELTLYPTGRSFQKRICAKLTIYYRSLLGRSQPRILARPCHGHFDVLFSKTAQKNVCFRCAPSLHIPTKSLCSRQSRAVDMQLTTLHAVSIAWARCCDSRSIELETST